MCIFIRNACISAEHAVETDPLRLLRCEANSHSYFFSSSSFSSVTHAGTTKDLRKTTATQTPSSVLTAASRSRTKKSETGQGALTFG